MLSRPWPIVILALFHILSPLINLIFSAQTSGTTPFQFIKWQWENSSLFDFAVMYTIFPVAGLAMLQFRKWSYYLYLALITLVIWANYRHWKDAPFLYDPAYAMFFFSINSILIGYFLTSPVRKIYFNERMRWWEHETRYLVEIPAELFLYNDNKKCIIRNISIGGAQIEVEGEQLDLGNLIELRFQYGSSAFSFKGEVLNQRGFTYGIQFEHDSDSEETLGSLIGEHLAPTHEDRDDRIPAIESFLVWFHRLVRTGEGIFPSKVLLVEQKRKKLKKKIVARAKKRQKSTRKYLSG